MILPRALPLAAMFCLAFSSSAPAQAISGTVRDVQGYPIPGARATIVGETTRVEVVTDPAGVFRTTGLPIGGYLVTIAMPGFRSRAERILVRGDRPVPPLDVTLAVAPLVSILWVVPQKPVAGADAIAHVRIVRTAAPAACGETVTAFHEVDVLASLKGSSEGRAVMAQEGAGVCLEAGRRVEGTEPLYRSGEEYIVFLRDNGTSFGRLAGPSLTFPVVDGLVTTRGFGGLPAAVTVAVFRDALQRAF